MFKIMFFEIFLDNNYLIEQNDMQILMQLQTSILLKVYMPIISIANENRFFQEFVHPFYNLL